MRHRIICMVATLLLSVSAPLAAQGVAMPQFDVRGGWTRVGQLEGVAAGLAVMWPTPVRRLRLGVSLDRVRAEFDQPITTIGFYGSWLPANANSLTSFDVTCTTCIDAYVQEATTVTADLRYDVDVGRLRPFVIVGSGYSVASESKRSNYSCVVQATAAPSPVCASGTVPHQSGDFFLPGVTAAATKRGLALAGGVGLAWSVVPAVALTVEYRVEQRAGTTVLRGLASADGRTPRASTLLIGVRAW